MTYSQLKQLTMAAAVAITMWTAPAQAMSDERLKVRLTEAAWCGETLLEAGEYTIRTLEMTGDQPVLQISQENNGATILVPAMRVKQTTRGNNAEIVIRRDSDAVRLSVVRFVGREYAYEIFPLGHREQR